MEEKVYSFTIQVKTRDKSAIIEVSTELAITIMRLPAESLDVEIRRWEMEG